MPLKKTRSRRLTPEERAKVFKALADPSRVAIVDILSKCGPTSGTELAEELGISLALLCHHWAVLAEAGIVRKDRVGHAQYCSLDISVIDQATASWGKGKESTEVRIRKQPRRRK
jgi:DNA-binding transcriptional ArsR family regulator